MCREKWKRWWHNEGKFLWMSLFTYKWYITHRSCLCTYLKVRFRSWKGLLTLLFVRFYSSLKFNNLENNSPQIPFNTSHHPGGGGFNKVLFREAPPRSPITSLFIWGRKQIFDLAVVNRKYDFDCAEYPTPELIDWQKSCRHLYFVYCLYS